MLYSAFIGYIHYEAPIEEQNFATLLEFLNAMEVREDDEEFKNAVDLMFEDLENKNPDHFAVRQYVKYKLAAGRTTENERGIIEDDYYEGVFELIDLTGLKRFDNGKIFPVGFDYNKEYYYEFYVEFEAGNTISGFSDDPDEVKAFIPVSKISI